jgi:hypothetical protein
LFVCLVFLKSGRRYPKAPKKNLRPKKQKNEGRKKKKNPAPPWKEKGKKGEQPPKVKKKRE